MKISVITPSYNQGQFIEQTILSVLTQTYPNIEYIVIDGGSTDNTMQVINKYRDRISVVVHEKDKGQSDAINKGFRLATGDFVGWINSDDLLLPNCVEHIAALIKQHPDGSIFYPANIKLIGQQGNAAGEVTKIIRDKATLVNNDYSIIQQGSFYRASLVKKVGFLDERIHYSMDLDLWLRLLDHGNIYCYGDEPLAAFRMWEDSKTATGGIKFLKDIKATLEKHNMKPFSKNHRRLHWYMLKARVKSGLKKVNII